MKRFRKVIGCLLILGLFVAAQASDTKQCNAAEIKTKLLISQSGRQKAMEDRGIKVTEAKDDVIQRTVRAYGGDYVRNADRATLTLQGKTYKDFTAQVVDGKYLRIKIPDDVFIMEIVKD